MARDENPPFGRGETWYNGGTATTSDPTAVVGKEWVFEDINPNTKAVRSNKHVKCRAVRNNSGISLLPRRIAQFSLTAGSFSHEVTGYTTTVAQRGYLVDEFLPSTGVPDKDVFWIVIEGPAEGISDLATADTIAVGDKLVALTAITSQATTAGRVDLIDLTGATSVLANQILHYLGHAMSALTSGNTNTAILIDVGHW
jgi:hypothetical protein